MSNLVQNPYEIFTDLNGDPLEDGYIFIGEPGLSPISNPLQAYWDTNLTIPANDIRTKGGYPANSGTPGRLYTNGNYSIVVQDKRGATQLTKLNSADSSNSITGTVATVDTIAELRELIPGEPNIQVSVGGSVDAGDGLMGPLYYWDASSLDVDNGASIIKPTDVVDSGRWRWINTNAASFSEVISTTSTLVLEFVNRIFLVDNPAPVVLTVPDGDFQGQQVTLSNIGVSTIEISGSGITPGTLVAGAAVLTWLANGWSVAYTGDTIGVDTVNAITVNTTTLNATDVITDTVDATGITTGTLVADTLNTGQGANELYDMNQNVKTTSSPTFANLTISNGYYSQGQTGGAIYTGLDPIIPTVGDYCMLSGGASVSSSGANYMWAYARRYTTTSIRLYMAISSDALSYITITSSTGQILSVDVTIAAGPRLG
jgi:hypothetical protein